MTIRPSSGGRGRKSVIITAIKRRDGARGLWILLVLREFHYTAALNTSKALTRYSISLWTRNSAFNRTLFRHRADFGWLSVAGHGLRLSSFRRLPSLRFSRHLQSNSIAALAADVHSTLWIGNKIHALLFISIRCGISWRLCAASFSRA